MRDTYNRFIPFPVIDPQRTQIVMPAFTLSASVWAGTSDLLAEYELGNNYYLSLKSPIRQFGENFLCAIRWVEDGIISRFKFWDDATAILYYPVYSGQKIGLNAVFEVWSLNTTDMPTLDSDYTFYSSVLNLPLVQGSPCPGCTQPSAVITLVQSTPSPLPPGACNPFCDNLC